MNNYLIPANSKKSLLIFNMFRGIDLLIAGVGCVTTLLLMFLVSDQGLSGIIIKLAPAGVCLFLVMPLPYYHNILVFLTEIFLFYNNPTKYIWRGWCASYVGNDDAEKDESKR
ncbi:MAG: hypothetical protein GX758_02065 [Tenericutes bacterium]|nr:hypothetical protein [Mycoplasmatota bacterium]